MWTTLSRDMSVHKQIDFHRSSKWTELPSCDLPFHGHKLAVWQYIDCLIILAQWVCSSQSQKVCTCPDLVCPIQHNLCFCVIMVIDVKYHHGVACLHYFLHFFLGVYENIAILGTKLSFQVCWYTDVELCFFICFVLICCFIYYIFVSNRTCLCTKDLCHAHSMVFKSTKRVSSSMLSAPVICCYLLLWLP